MVPSDNKSRITVHPDDVEPGKAINYLSEKVIDLAEDSYPMHPGLQLCLYNLISGSCNSHLLEYSLCMCESYLQTLSPGLLNYYVKGYMSPVVELEAYCFVIYCRT